MNWLMWTDYRAGRRENPAHGKWRWRQQDRIIALETEAFRNRQAQLNVAPTIVSLRRRIEEIRRAELARTRGMFGNLTREQETALESLTQGLVNKIATHPPFH